MYRSARTHWLAIVAIVTIGVSCDAPRVNSPRVAEPGTSFSEEEPEISEERVQEIWASDEVQRVLALQDTFVMRIDHALERGRSLEEIRSAAHAAVDGDDARLAELLFEGEEEAASFVASLQEARSAVVEAFPEVAQAQTETDPEACTAGTRTVDTFFDRWEQIRQSRLDPTQDVAARRSGVPTCGSYWKQLKLLACAGLCSATTAGLATPFCGWGCWCTFCTNNSALADLIC